MRGGARRSSGAAAVAGGHWLGVWDGEDELPGAALSGVGRLLAGIGRGEQPLGGDADGARSVARHLCVRNRCSTNTGTILTKKCRSCRLVAELQAGRRHLAGTEFTRFQGVQTWPTR